MDFQHIIEAVGRYMDFAGVAVMVIGAVVSIPMALRGYQPSDCPRMPSACPFTGLTANCWGAPFC